jgi:hypothetical protein
MCHFSDNFLIIGRYFEFACSSGEGMRLIAKARSLASLLTPPGVRVKVTCEIYHWMESHLRAINRCSDVTKSKSISYQYYYGNG